MDANTRKLLNDLMPKDNAEFHVLWNALAAFVEDAERCIDEPKYLNEAKGLLERFDKFAAEAK